MPDSTYDPSVLAKDAAFRNAPVSQKIAYLSSVDPDFAKADPKSQAGYINHIIGNDRPTQFEVEHSPGPEGGVWNHLKSAFGLTKGAGPSEPDISSVIPGIGAAMPIIHNVTDTVMNAPANWRAGLAAGKASASNTPFERQGISPGAMTGAAYAAAPLVGIHPAAVESAANRGDVGGIIGELAPGAVAAATPILAEAAGRLPGLVNSRRILGGSKKVGAGLGIPTSDEAAALSGPTAPPDIKAAQDFQTARPHLAQIERDTPVSGKDSAATFQRAKNIYDYANRLWEQGHTEPIARVTADNPQLTIDNQAIYNAGRKAITPEGAQNASSEATSAQNWLDSINQPRNLQSADALAREIYADINSPRAQQAYGPLLMRAKGAVMQELRNQIDTSLQGAGEQGVRDVNNQWGALNRMGDQATKTGLGLSKAEGRGGIVPDWLHAYAFMHPELEGGMGVSAGLGLNPGRMFLSSPGAKLAKGMRQLGRSDLTPPVLPPPPTSFTSPTSFADSPAAALSSRDFQSEIVRPAEVGNAPSGTKRLAGLLPAPPDTTPPPVNPSAVSEGTGTVQPITLGPGTGGPLYRGLLRPPSPRGLPALPETSSAALPPPTLPAIPSSLGAPPPTPTGPSPVIPPPPGGSALPSSLRVTTDSNGIRWASNGQTQPVSIPSRIADADIEGYARPMLDQQAKLTTSLKNRLGQQ